MKRTRPNPRYINQHTDDNEPEALHILKDGLPYQAFAVAPDLNDPITWLAPHHTKLAGSIKKNVTGPDKTVDWQKMEESVQTLSRQGIEGNRIKASPEILIVIARHLAMHYMDSGRPLPDALAVLI